MNKLIKNITFVAFLTIVLFALASCSTLGGATSEPTTVSVSGTGVVYLKADIVTFSINVNETADTTAEAQQKTNEKMTRIFEILRAFGIEDDSISTTALNFSSEYYWDNGRQIKTGESVSQTVYVTMKDLDQFPKLADELGSRLTGISFYNVNFDSTQKEAAYAKARELEELVTERTHLVLLAHISRECNKPEIALDECRRELEHLGRSDVRVSPLAQSAPSELFLLEEAL